MGLIVASTLSQALGALDEAKVDEEVRRELAAETPALSILGELQEGMQLVGEQYECNEYFLSELILASEIFKNASALLAEGLAKQTDNKLGTMVLGTVKNDIHDFGKDIVRMVLESNGVEVVDLGVNVPYERFVEAVREHSPRMVGLSCLLTTLFDDMRATVDALAQAGLRDQVTILVGGGPVDKSVADYVGADLYCEDAQGAVEAAKRVLGVS